MVEKEADWCPQNEPLVAGGSCTITKPDDRISSELLQLQLDYRKSWLPFEWFFLPFGSLVLCGKAAAML